jgi:HD-like signal output (HDOD) protein
VSLAEAERQVFGVSHAEVGAYLLGLWGLPSKVVEAVAWHHVPTPTARFDLTTALHAAEAILASEEAGEVDAAYLGRLGLTDRLPAWRELAADLLGSGSET